MTVNKLGLVEQTKIEKGNLPDHKRYGGNQVPHKHDIKNKKKSK